jgi:hypothetical protein
VPKLLRTTFNFNMRIHSEFYGLKRSPAWIVDALNGPEVTDGGFARVVILSDLEVLKATSCSATNLLFEELHQLYKKNRPMPPALPAVTGHHGPSVKDVEGLVYRVWTVERLFSAENLPVMRRARLLAKKQLSAVKPSYKTRFKDLDGNGLVHLKDALEQEQKLCVSPGTWQGCAEIAMTMSMRSTGELRETFLFLHEFIVRNELELDLLTKGNILLNMFGSPNLSDPVCVPEPSMQMKGAMSGPCIAAFIPVSVNGFSVDLAPETSLPLQAEELTALKGELTALGLEAMEMSWGSPAHRQFMAMPAQKRQIFSLPNARRHMDVDRYRRLFIE